MKEGKEELVLLCEEDETTSMPHCQGAKVIKNGRRKNANQQYLYKSCKKRYQESYLYKGSDPDVKELAKRMLVRGSVIQDISYTLKISTSCVLCILLSYLNIPLIPKLDHDHQVQVDELYSFIQNKRKY